MKEARLGYPITGDERAFKERPGTYKLRGNFTSSCPKPGDRRV